MELVKKHNDFEGIIKQTKTEPDFDYKEIEEIFLHPEFSNDYKIEFGQLQKEKILDFLCNQRDFSKERVENALKKLETKMDFSAKQSRLSAWS